MVIDRLRCVSYYAWHLQRSVLEVHFIKQSMLYYCESIIIAVLVVAVPSCAIVLHNLRTLSSHDHADSNTASPPIAGLR